MDRILFSFLTVLVGALIGLHLAMNGKLGMEFGAVASDKFRAVAAANLFFWGTGALAALLSFLAFGPGSPVDYFRAATKPLLTAGAIGALILFAITFLIPEKVGGAGPGFIFLVVGQVLIGLVISHFGLLGSTPDPLTLKKAAGVALLFGGLYLATA